MFAYWGETEAAVFETIVVPTYLRAFAEPLVQSMTPSDGARVFHLACRTGYPDLQIQHALGGADIFGCDGSEAALALARAKYVASGAPGAAEYILADDLPTPFPDAAFSHALSLHPAANVETRAALFREMKRVLAPSGQCAVSLPLRGTFQEVADLLREFALKTDAHDVAFAVDEASLAFPTPESLASEVEGLGYSFVDVEVHPKVFAVKSGRDLLEDPALRWFLWSHFDVGREAQRYVADAADKYFRETQTELSLFVGCVTARA